MLYCIPKTNIKSKKLIYTYKKIRLERAFNCAKTSDLDTNI